MCSPLPADAINKTVDTVSSDAASLKHTLGHGVIDSLKGCQGVALYLQGAASSETGIGWQSELPSKS